MPTIPSIRTSVENKNVLVIDEHAKNGTFERDARGRLIAYSGGFSVVFPYRTDNGEKWAFRCWHSDIQNSKKRYETISDAIKKANLNFLCEFQYIDKGINVEGNIYPITRMRWIDGITIKDYICQNRYSKDKLTALADTFLKMTQALHAQSLAHGDLQHGNILVDNNQQLYLVDYDSFYCPQLNGEADTVIGFVDYQHPARIYNKLVSEKLDYFSELIIYLSILAIAEKPLLVDKYKIEDADRLLFAKEDYVDIKNSNIYKDLYVLGEKFQELFGILERYLECKSIDELLPFEFYLLENKIIFSASAEKAIRNKQTVSIKWEVPFEASVSFAQSNNKDLLSSKQNDEYVCVLSNDTTFTLSVTTKEGQRIEKGITIRVFDECEIELSADKYHVFPSIPVTLTWKVRNAKKVWLDKEVIEASGTKVIEPSKEMSIILSAEDEFGIKEKQIDIGMLPIPQVEALLVPTPNFVSNTSVNIQQPRFSLDVRIPQIDIDWIKTGIHKVPSLTENGVYRKLYRRLSSPLPVCNLNIVSLIKKVFDNIIRNGNGE